MRANNRDRPSGWKSRLPGRTESGRRIRVLFVYDPPSLQPELRRHLAIRGFVVSSAPPGPKLPEVVNAGEIDVVVLERPRTTEIDDGVLEKLRGRESAVEVIVLTDRPSFPSALRCARADCFCYMEAPCEKDELLDLVLEAGRKSATRRQFAVTHS